MNEEFSGDRRDTKPLSAIDLENIEKAVGLNENDFTEGWRFKAIEYNAFIWALANSFSDGQCEATHFDFTLKSDGTDPDEIFACLTFFEDSQKTFDDFKQWLDEHQQLIPQQLRDRFTMYIGYNYGNDGGVRINGQTIDRITQKDIEATYSKPEEPIGIGFEQLKEQTLQQRKKIDKIKDEIWNAIEKKLEK